MEAYILDSLYRRIRVVDSFISFIWTENFAAKGDFQLDLLSTGTNKAIFVPGVKLAMNKSYRVMLIETVEDSVDDEGRKILKITGSSMESVLENRGIYGTYTGTPKVIATKLFHDICVNGLINTGDIIPSVVEGSIFPSDTIAAPTETITYTIDFMDLYKALKDLCDRYGMGFRLVRNLDTSILYFDVYMGSDRTTGQTGLPAVVFSPDLENLQNTAQLTSNSTFKNVAYVKSPVGFQVVYADNVDTDMNGFERRVLAVNATDITDVDVPTATAKMIRRGKEELAKNRQYSALDGELVQSAKYVYEQHYYLGDLVEIRDENGTTSNMQVTQQIFVHDAQGERSYPTLSVNRFIFPGSWLAWDFNQEWEDLTTDHWSDLP